MASVGDIKVNIDVSEIEKQIAKMKKEIEDFLIMTGDIRILKGWTEEEQKELEEAEGNDFNSAIDLINGIVGDDDDCTSLTDKYMNESSNEDNQMAKDIVDFYCGTAKFPDKKYRIALPDGNYLIKDRIEGNRWLFTCSENGCHLKYSTDCEDTFTKEQIESIDPRYMTFAVPVEE